MDMLSAPASSLTLLLLASLSGAREITWNIGSAVISGPGPNFDFLDTMVTLPKSCLTALDERLQCGPDANITQEECEERSCCYDADTTLPVGILRCFHHSVDEVTVEFETKLETGDSWCSGNGSDFHMADVNGDGHTDLICFKQGGTPFVFFRMFNVSSGMYTDPQPYNENSWELAFFMTYNQLPQAERRILVGDVNGDGAADLVGLSVTGQYIVLPCLPTNDATVQGTWNAWADTNFHFCDGGKASLGDFDGDGRKDLLCKMDGPNPERTVALSDGISSFKAPRKDPSFDDFCSADGDRMHVADFDSDYRDDLLCQRSTSRDLQIALTDGDGFIINEDFNFPNWCVDPSDRIYPGDYNGDGRRDVLCHFTDGRLCIRLGSYIFRDEDMFEAESCMNQTFPQNDTTVVVDPSGPDSDDDNDDINVVNNTDSTVDTAQPQILPSTVEFRQVDWRNTNTSLFCDNRQVYVADTAADGRLHLICHDEIEGLVWVAHSDGYGRPVVAPPALGHNPDVRFCGRSNYEREPPRLLVGHYDTDGRNDLFCHSKVDGTITVLQAASSGDTPYQSQPIVVDDTGYCSEPGDRLEVLDRTPRTDLVCLHGHDSISIMTVLTSSLSPVNSPSPLYPCPPSATTEHYRIIVGFINNDQLHDIICHSPKDGEVIVKLGKPFQPTFSSVAGRLTFCPRGDLEATLRIGDYNGDNFGDILCHDRNGDVTVMYNQQANNRFANMVFGDDYTVNLDFNKHPGSYFQSIDVNGDDFQDLVSHDRLGNIAIVEGHVTTRNATTVAAANQAPAPAPAPIGFTSGAIPAPPPWPPVPSPTSAADYSIAATPTSAADYSIAATPTSAADYSIAATPTSAADYSIAATPTSAADYSIAATPTSAAYPASDLGNATDWGNATGNFG